MRSFWKNIVITLTIGFGVLLVCSAITYAFPDNGIIDETFYWCLAAGFFAQLVDGMLGMGYGIVSASFLLSFNINLASISSSIHTSEIFTSAASGYSHYKFGNVDMKLFKRLVIPGVIGAVLGAACLSYFGEAYASWVKPVLAIYILILGIKYLFLFFRKVFIHKEIKHVGRLAATGGFLDSFGGGGWGPLVTSTLLRTSSDPKSIIGSVSLTEFFVTFSSALTFFAFIGIAHWNVIIALITGGVLAAPVAALLAGRISKKASYLLIGILTTIWSLKILIPLI